VLETEPTLIEEYVRTGKARLVYRHLVQLGVGSQSLAEASECAGAQGRFWEMREMLYARQSDLFAVTGYAGVAPLVQELGLDEPRFQQCMDQHEFQKQVEADADAAEREGIVSRPVMDIAGTRIIGSQPIDRFRAVLDSVQ
jgi:protein-disulfide isomerase